MIVYPRKVNLSFDTLPTGLTLYLDGIAKATPFIYDTLGMMGSLGHGKAFGQLLKVRVRGVLAWFVRRTYYLLQMPGWRRRLRIMIDWTFALLFRPDVVKISLESEEVERRREAASTRPVPGPSEQGAACSAEGIGSRPLTTGGSV